MREEREEGGERERDRERTELWEHRADHEKKKRRKK